MPDILHHSGQSTFKAHLEHIQAIAANSALQLEREAQSVWILKTRESLPDASPTIETRYPALRHSLRNGACRYVISQILMTHFRNSSCDAGKHFVHPEERRIVLLDIA